MLTVRELAESLGKSKPGIMKRIDELELRDQLTKEGNKLLIPNEVVEIVRSSFEKRTEPKQTASKRDQQADIIDMLKSTIEILERQLAEKDQTIAKLLDQLSEKERSNLEAIRAIQQGNYLLTTTSEATEVAGDQEQTSNKRGILGRLFK